MNRATLAALCIALGVTAGCERRTEPATQAPVAPEEAPQPATTPRRVIEVHAHLNPFAYDAFFETTRAVGVQRVINLSGGSTPERRAEALAAATAHHGRVLLFHNIDWSGIDDADFGAREARRLAESVGRGFAGLKVSKALGLGVRTADGALVPVDDPRLDPIWAQAGELGVPVAIHTGDPKAFFEPPTPDNERYEELSAAPGWSFYGGDFPARAELLAARDRLIARHRNTNFILVHLANNPEDVDYVDELLANNPNAYADIAARVGEFGRHDAARMQRFFTRHADRILFGTDIMLALALGPGGRPDLRLTLGSISRTPLTLEDIAPFYAAHFRYFETAGPPIAHPVPIQGDWQVNPVGLQRATLDRIYFQNAERLIAAPHLGRSAATMVASTATRLAPHP